MKLFGGKPRPRPERALEHKPKPENKPKPEIRPKPDPGGTQSAAGERLRAFFRGELWRRLRIPAIALGCVLLALLLLALAYAIWEKPPAQGETGLHTPNIVRPAVTEPIATPPPTESPEPSPEPTPEPTPVRLESCYTFAVAAYDQLGVSTDVVLVGRLDSENLTLDVVSIPQDTLVNVSWGVKKLNSVMVSERGDPERFVEHLTDLLGFQVDNYVILDIDVVEKLVDCIGGIYFYVPRDMDYDAEDQDLHIHIAKGSQLLLGEDAVKVLRYRMGNDGSGYPNGDLGRIATQQSLLKALASQLLKLKNIPNLDKIQQIIESDVQTDLTANNIAFYVREFLQMKEESVRFQTAPGKGVSIRGGSYFELDVDGWLAMINESLNPYDTDVTAENLDVLRALGREGAISTTGELVPLGTFYNYNG